MTPHTHTHRSAPKRLAAAHVYSPEWHSLFCVWEKAQHHQACRRHQDSVHVHVRQNRAVWQNHHDDLHWRCRREQCHARVGELQSVSRCISLSTQYVVKKPTTNVTLASVWVCIHTYMYTYVWVYVYIYMYICTCTCTCVYVCVCVCVCVYVCICIYVCIYIYVHTYVYIYMCIYTHRYIYIHIYIYMICMYVCM